MNKHLFTILLLLCSMLHCAAQDIITQKSGRTIEGKILKVTPTEIKYKRTDIPNSYLHIIPREEVAFIRYENRTIDSSFLLHQEYIISIKKSSMPVKLIRLLIIA